MVAALHPQIVAVSLDRETARAAGLPVLLLDVLLSVAVSLAVVISVQTIGNVLVLALLVTPAADRPPGYHDVAGAARGGAGERGGALPVLVH